MAVPLVVVAMFLLKTRLRQDPLRKHAGRKGGEQRNHAAHQDHPERPVSHIERHAAEDDESEEEEGTSPRRPAPRR